MRRRVKRGLVIVAVIVAAPLIFITLLGVTYRPDLTIPAGRSGQHLDVAGTKIRYVQKGAGPDVLLVHGCPGSIEDWDTMIDLLAEDFRVTAFDRPGHAYSGADGDLYTYDYHASVVLALIETLELRDVTLVGHSYGGGTALAAALRKPSAVKSIVILDSAVYELTEKPSFIYRVLALPGFGTGFARLAGSRIAPPRIAAGLRAQFPNGEPPEGFVETRQQIWNQPKVTVAVAHELLRSDRELLAMSPKYSSIELPTFIAAQADHPLRRQTGERLASEIAGAQLVLLSGTGHYVHVEKPDDVIALVRQAVEAATGRVSAH
jgi:pimeloyl-ACP methyl ester carboxylesterase